ncbi:hypothetical protein Sgleb_13060 [Streptomyces glebosus]|uniref:Type II toxin-antitoxin system RelE/ParE family toxin n=1 Tax=Streptomyces glebosus TaxID=249580 RepID=A0A640SPC2_9ACTN|nr:hypothetical protein Sgleb_13060 [Streptomyces glebosus]GHG66738.1 hypothetical protein GCM10010513_36260 [Streptomyces glebosus]
MDTIDLLAAQPRPEGTTEYGSTDLRRMHVGRYQVLYEITEESVTLMVVQSAGSYKSAQAVACRAGMVGDPGSAVIRTTSWSPSGTSRIAVQPQRAGSRVVQGLGAVPGCVDRMCLPDLPELLAASVQFAQECGQLRVVRVAVSGPAQSRHHDVSELLGAGGRVHPPPVQEAAPGQAQTPRQWADGIRLPLAALAQKARGTLGALGSSGKESPFCVR